jgi:predicted Zn-dependent protease
VIEIMLEAERAMAVGLLDKAERLYAQVAAADPRNSIAVMGLARIALERDNQRGAYLLARRALALDPDNPMASHMARRMAEVMAGRGEPPPDDSVEPPKPAAVPAPEPDRPGLIDRIRRRR